MIGAGYCLLSVSVVMSVAVCQYVCVACFSVCVCVLCWLRLWLQDFELSPQMLKRCEDYSDDGFVNRLGAALDSVASSSQQHDEALVVDCRLDAVCWLFGIVGVVCLLVFVDVAVVAVAVEAVGCYHGVDVCVVR